MENFINLLKTRRSTRKYTDEQLTPEQVELLMKAALMSPTSKNSHSWEFILVDEKHTLEQLSLCKPHGASFIANASLAVIVSGNMEASDVWVEDASIAAAVIQLQAEDMGLGSCWVQVRQRMTAAGDDSEEYVRELLNIPSNIGVLAIIGIGNKNEQRKPFDEDRLLWEKLHLNSWKMDD